MPAVKDIMRKPKTEVIKWDSITSQQEDELVLAKQNCPSLRPQHHPLYRLATMVPYWQSIFLVFYY